MNVLLAIAALTALPRLRMRLRRVLGPALFVAAGLEALKTVDRLYVQRTEANPAYQVVTGAVAVLVFLSLLNQFILFAAALTATSTHGPITDLAAAPPPARRVAAHPDGRHNQLPSRDPAPQPDPPQDSRVPGAPAPPAALAATGGS